MSIDPATLRARLAPGRTGRGVVRAVVLDWAGTTVDHGSRAPAIAFVRAFAALGVRIDPDQARGPMGLSKRDHVRALLDLPEVGGGWRRAHGRPPGPETVERVYETFVPLQREALEAHADLIPGTLELVRACARRGIRVGSTTGYSRDLMDVLEPLAARVGYRPEV